MSNNQIELISHFYKKDRSWVFCRCFCGNKFIGRKSHILSNNIKSYGCLKKYVNITHGKSKDELILTQSQASEKWGVKR